MTEQVLSWGLAAVGGAGLAAVFYGGLWWTVRRLPGTRHPFLLMLASFALRTLLVVAGFYLLMVGDWRKLIAAGAGFIFVRIVLMSWMRQPGMPL